MSQSPNERATATLAMDLLEHVYRLCEIIEARRGQRIADSLLRVSIPIPGLTARAGQKDWLSADEALAALHDTETLLMLAVRTRKLSLRESDAAVRAIRRLLDRLRSMGSAGAGGPAPAPTSVNTPVLRVRRSLPATRVRSNVDRKEHLLVHAGSFLAEIAGAETLGARLRDWLLSQLQEYVSDHPAHRVTVFFDEPIASSRVTVGVEERAADGAEASVTLILDTVRALPSLERSHCTVVTADERLAACAAYDGAGTQTARWLLTQFMRRHLEMPAENRTTQSEPTV